MASGDNCRFLRGPDGMANGLVEHHDCDDYGDNCITDINGNIVKYRPKHWLVDA